MRKRKFFSHQQNFQRRRDAKNRLVILDSKSELKERIREISHNLLEIEAKSEVGKGGRVGDDVLVEIIAEGEVDEGGWEVVYRLVEIHCESEVSESVWELIHWPVERIAKSQVGERGKFVHVIIKICSQGQGSEGKREGFDWIVEFVAERERQQRRGKVVDLVTEVGAQMQVGESGGKAIHGLIK